MMTLFSYQKNPEKYGNLKLVSAGYFMLLGHPQDIFNPMFFDFKPVVTKAYERRDLMFLMETFSVTSKRLLDPSTSRITTLRHVMLNAGYRLASA